MSDECVSWQVPAWPRLKISLPDYERAVRLNSGTRKRRESAKGPTVGKRRAPRRPGATPLLLINDDASVDVLRFSRTRLMKNVNRGNLIDSSI